jgi:CRISPR system Cascade subunit CasB
MSETATQQQTFDEKFISYLEKFVRDENRAALAHLRRGLGKDSATATEMFPYISGWTANLTRRDENAYFLVASLIGLYPTNSWKSEEKFNNLGRSFSFLKEDSDSIEKRFVALLNSETEDLPNHLRQIVSLLKSKEAPINWLQLLKDIKFWEIENSNVQRNWAKGFWGNSTENTEKGEEK